MRQTTRRREEAGASRGLHCARAMAPVEMSEQPDTIRAPWPGAALVVDLAEPGRVLEIGPDVERVQVSLLWGGTAVGELVTEVGSSRRASSWSCRTTCSRTAAELDLADRLRPVLAPRAERGASRSRRWSCARSGGRSSSPTACEPRRACATRPHELDRGRQRPVGPALGRGRRAASARAWWPEPRRGLSAARNAGIRAARSPVVAFLDDDCRVEPGWLDDLAAEFADPLVAARGRLRRRGRAGDRRAVAVRGAGRLRAPPPPGGARRRGRRRLGRGGLRRRQRLLPPRAVRADRRLRGGARPRHARALGPGRGHALPADGDTACACATRRPGSPGTATGASSSRSPPRSRAT